MAQVSITPLGNIPQVQPLDFSKPFDRLFQAVIKRNERERNQDKKNEIAEGFNQLRSNDPAIQDQGFNRVLAQDSKLAGTALKFLEPGMQQRLKEEQEKKRTEVRKRVLAGDKKALAELSPSELNSLVNLKTIQNKEEENKERGRVANAANNATEILKGKTNRAQLNQINLMMENINSNPDLSAEQKNESIQDLIRLGEMGMEGRAISLNKTKRAARAFDSILNTAFAPTDTAAASAIGKPSPKDFTPDSLEKFNESGNFADLVAVERPPDRRGREQFSRGSSFQGRNAAGENVLFTPILDKFSGKLTVQEDILPGQLISRIGETPAQTQQRAIETAGGKTTATGQAARLQTTINDGITAAEGLGTLNRSIELLDTIKTGGLAGAKLRFEQFIGVQGADEAELGANLLRTVLAQLRPTFGAQFTEREGTKLERIEAGIGKSTAGNIRVIKQLKTIIEREARRGIAAAKKAGDDFSAEEIDKLMKFKITAPGTQPVASATGQNQPIGSGEFNFNPGTGQLEPVGGP